MPKIPDYRYFACNQVYETYLKETTFELYILSRNPGAKDVKKLSF